MSPLRTAFTLLVTLQVAAGSAQYLRGLVPGTGGGPWRFASFRIVDRQETLLAPLRDSLPPWDNGYGATLDHSTQRYHYLAESPSGIRYVVTLNAFDGTTISAVSAPGVFAIRAVHGGGALVGFRYLVSTQVVRINPNTGFTQPVLTVTNAVAYSFGAQSGDTDPVLNHYYFQGDFPFGTSRPFAVNLVNGFHSSGDPGLVRAMRYHSQAQAMYGIRTQNSPSLRHALVRIDGTAPPTVVVLRDSLPLYNVGGTGEPTEIDPYSNTLYRMGRVNSGDPLELIAFDLATGNRLDNFPVGELRGFACTVHPPLAATDMVSGRVTWDANGDGVPDAGELGMTNQLITIQPGIQVLTGPSGHYAVPLVPGAYTINLYPTAGMQISSMPATYSVTSTGTGTAHTGRDFSVSSISSTPTDDVSISITPSRAVTGQPQKQTITIENKGNTVLNGEVTYEAPAEIPVTSTSEPPSSVNGNTFTFSFTDLLPGEQRIIEVYGEVPPNPDLLGNTYTSTATVSANSGGNDITRSASTTQPFYGSYDPNDKQVNDVEMYTDAQPNELLRYRIRFQNTGNDTAYRVILRDTLHYGLDRASLRMLGSSHDYLFSLDAQGVATWDFQNILLPDSGTNQLGSNGFVEFAVELSWGVQPSQLIPNVAAIYFDFNPPVITNSADAVIASVIGIAEHEPFGSELWPNPTSGAFNFIPPARAAVDPMDLALLDRSGRLVHRWLPQRGTHARELEVPSHLSAGHYVLRATWTDGIDYSPLAVMR